MTALISRLPTDHWHPQPGPQTALVQCPYPEVFFGGARGGGKTDGVLGKWALKERLYGSAFNAIMFRRTTVSSEDAIERSKAIYTPLGGKFNESKLIWRMPNGGRVAFAYLDKVSDADEYQGRNLTDAWVEEAGQYADPAPIDRLYGVLRSAEGVPIQLILTGNPGGPGQQWIRQRYRLVPFPRHPLKFYRTPEGGEPHTVVVIPSRITDNRIMLDADPGYLNRLRLTGGAALVKAWLDGDWSAIEGAFFDEWSEARHVIAPCLLPERWPRFRSADWGSAKPFSIGWWAIATDDWRHPTKGQLIKRGALVRYREWYGCPPEQYNTGLKLPAEEVAKGIKARESSEELIAYSVMDPAAFASDGGPSIAERFFAGGVSFKRADNKRVAQRGAMGGWDLMRHRLRGDAEGHPMIFCFETCRDSIRTIPVLQHDETHPEDLDTDMEDHAADEWRYACSSRPWIPQAEKPKPAPPPLGSVRIGPPERQSSTRIKV